MATETRHSGTLRTDYEADRARMDDLRPLTADTDILLHRLIQASREMPYRDADGREGTLTPLLENHVLTVLADIRRKRLTGYGGTFAGAQGTAEQARYARKLEKNVEGWARRLEAYLNVCLPTTGTDSASAEVARELLDRLKNALQGMADENNRRYYRMLRTVTSIQENADRYWQQASESGDTEPAIALLLAHLKNYAGIAEAFNRRFASLPELYCREVLHAVPKDAVPDNAYLIVTPIGKGFTLAQGTAFAAGEDLTYKTTQREYISLMRCVGAQAVHKDKSGVHIQKLNIEDTSTAETLFAEDKELRTGWQIESPMLVLEEGRREVEIRFVLDKAETGSGTKPGFTVEYATVEGWTDAGARCELSDNGLMFRFIIERDGTAPTPCTQDLHGIATAYPALRILTTNKDYPTWADGLTFREVRITVEVNGIRGFTFLNELGEADTTQPFAPFGMQAERGAWFIFGNEETGMKPLKEVTLTGKWQKFPETRKDINDIYGGYNVDASNFQVRTEYQKNKDWQKGDKQPLFRFDSGGNMEGMNLLFTFSTNTPATRADSTHYEYARDKDGFFRVTLDSPDIGFGAAAYRERFAEVMIRNSRRKEKDMEALPKEPPVPLLADVEMAYKAEDTAKLSTCTSASICLSRITELPGQKPFPLDDEETQPLLRTFSGDRLLYFHFHDVKKEKVLRVYADMALPQERIPYDLPQPGQSARLSWEYMSGGKWEKIPPEAVTAEETAGLSRSGFIEIELSGLKKEYADDNGQMWLRASVTGDTSACLALRGVWTNCIKATADGGDGSSLPAGTIQGTVEEDGRIGSVTQPLPGFGGIPAETESRSASRQSIRLHNRHRAVTPKDYEELVMEHFPEIEKAQCFTQKADDGRTTTSLVVFSRAEDSRYFLSPAWKLSEIRNVLEQHAPPFVRLQVVNPVYQKVAVTCKAVLQEHITDEAAVLRGLASLARNYLAPWLAKEEIPAFRQCYSYKELHARLANHEAVMRLALLEVDGRSLEKVDYDTEDIPIRGEHPWSIPVPDIEVELLSPSDGIGESEIGANFIIR